MKVLLALGVVLACSVALSSAQCMTSKLNFNLKTRTTGCEHKGKFYKIGSAWTLDCEECSCNKHGMSCCSLTRTPIYDKKECVAVFHKESCSYTVTKKSNPSEPCEIKAMVG
ncbi:beta-microseminoprotein-like [Hyla sarda]|uniref:beta-microseminoprotein-like n=1 Tax=Hyla sarda TaxID=327740 RepID=UPI0024C45626|nr:beta-microseminoprotein-like [Hyla sarda]